LGALNRYIIWWISVVESLKKVGASGWRIVSMRGILMAAVALFGATALTGCYHECDDCDRCEVCGPGMRCRPYDSGKAACTECAPGPKPMAGCAEVDLKNAAAKKPEPLAEAAPVPDVPAPQTYVQPRPLYVETHPVLRPVARSASRIHGGEVQISD
jgi:hypothetical protein